MIRNDAGEYTDRSQRLTESIFNDEMKFQQLRNVPSHCLKDGAEMVSDNFAHSLSSDVGIIDLNDDQIALVNGGLSTIARAFIGSFLGKAVYDAVKHVAENGGPPPPNLGFH